MQTKDQLFMSRSMIKLDDAGSIAVDQGTHHDHPITYNPDTVDS